VPATRTKQKINTITSLGLGTTTKKCRKGRGTSSAKKICNRGGKKSSYSAARKRCVAAGMQRAQRIHFSRLGAEGFGEKNDVDKGTDFEVQSVMTSIGSDFTVLTKDSHFC